MIINSYDAEKQAALDVANLMAAAARTAPKACGDDSIIVKIVEGEDLNKLGDLTSKIGEKNNINYFIRDGKTMHHCHCAVLIGLEDSPLGLGSCGYCGFNDCGECFSNGSHCTLKVTDLGIAVGSAASVAMNHKIDNRVLYSVGKAAVKMGIFDNQNVKIAYAIPLAVDGKNIFFDRESIQEK